MSTAPDSAPWLRHYGAVPAHLYYPERTLYQMIAATAAREPERIAWDFFDRQCSYRQLLADIDVCANALSALGLGRDDRFLIAMPTTPQSVIAFYAANKLGVLPALIHPLSAPPEIEHYLDVSGARVALTLDAFYGSFAQLHPQRPLETILLSRLGDDLPPLKRLGFWLTKGRRIPRVPADARVRWWKPVTWFLFRKHSTGTLTTTARPMSIACG